MHSLDVFKKMIRQQKFMKYDNKGCVFPTHVDMAEIERMYLVLKELKTIDDWRLESEDALKKFEPHVAVYQKVTGFRELEHRLQPVPTGYESRHYLQAKNIQWLKIMTYWLGGDTIVNLENLYEERRFLCSKVVGVRGTPAKLIP
jgi:hypothetical protein